jgi:SAM-dependent methyltransferase
MARAPAHPLAQHPLRGNPRLVTCSLPLSDRTYLTALLLEASLEESAEYVKGKLLDVGCGNRPYEKTYFGSCSQYIGCDYLSDRSKPDVVCSALDLAFPDNEFDTVVSTEVLEHVPDPLRALKEMYRVAKPGAHVIVSTPMYWPRHEVPYDFFRYPYDGILHLVKESGLELVKLYNRGHSYVFLAQVFQFVHPVRLRAFTWLVNRLALWCDLHLNHDTHTLGWTFVAKKPGR